MFVYKCFYRKLILNIIINFKLVFATKQFEYVFKEDYNEISFGKFKNLTTILSL